MHTYGISYRGLVGEDLAATRVGVGRQKISAARVGTLHLDAHLEDLTSAVLGEVGRVVDFDAPSGRDLEVSASA